MNRCIVGVYRRHDARVSRLAKREPMCCGTAVVVTEQLSRFAVAPTLRKTRCCFGHCRVFRLGLKTYTRPRPPRRRLHARDVCLVWPKAQSFEDVHASPLLSCTLLLLLFTRPPRCDEWTNECMTHDGRIKRMPVACSLRSDGGEASAWPWPRAPTFAPSCASRRTICSSPR